MSTTAHSFRRIMRLTLSSYVRRQISMSQSLMRTQEGIFRAALAAGISAQEIAEIYQQEAAEAHEGLANYAQTITPTPPVAPEKMH